MTESQWVGEEQMLKGKAVVEKGSKTLSTDGNGAENFMIRSLNFTSNGVETTDSAWLHKAQFRIVIN